MNTSDYIKSLNWQPVADYNKQLPYQDQLLRIRHSAAHLMASAVLNVKGQAHFATGPATARGFHYDFRMEGNLQNEDLAAIEDEMKRLVSAKLPFEFASIPKAYASPFFEALGQPLKREVLENIEGESVTLYRVGDYIDLCAGPHVSHSGNVKAFKLLNVSAAHWREEEQPSLTRISGTAWDHPKKLRLYLDFLAETKKRDHRTLGPQLGLFNFHPWAASAMWQPNGVTFRRILEDFWRETIFEADKYVEICNPILYKKDLFETSGHWDHFHEDMFVIEKEGEVDFVLKPMNCPDTMLFFASKTRSYRELPLRVAEGQILHRNEAAGALHGIMRARNFQQDDAHIFLGAEHLESEINDLLEMVDQVYSIFGLEYEMALSTRPSKFMGDPELWDKAESSLQRCMEANGKAFRVDPGEGAFYGPKIDITIKDSLGRAWQCGTVQLDFQLPIRFDLKYTDDQGELVRPIVIHRAIFGSFERFMGIVIEHFGGAFPTWLSPVQATILPIAEGHIDYAHEVKKGLKARGIRVTVDDSNSSLNYKIRNAESSKTPYILIAGDREMEAGSVNVRRYGGARLGSKDLTEIGLLLEEANTNRPLDVQLKDFSKLLTDLPDLEIPSDSY